MSAASRADATAKRERFWLVYDHAPDDQLTAGCAWCENGWAVGPGLIYRCDNCNPGEPHTFSTEPVCESEPTRERVGIIARLRRLLTTR